MPYCHCTLLPTLYTSLHRPTVTSLYCSRSTLPYSHGTLLTLYTSLHRPTGTAALYCSRSTLHYTGLQSLHSTTHALHFPTQAYSHCTLLLTLYTFMHRPTVTALYCSRSTLPTVSLHFSTQALHFPTQVLHFPTQAPAQSLYSTAQALHFPTQALHFPTQALHFHAQSLHFPTQSLQSTWRPYTSICSHSALVHMPYTSILIYPALRTGVLCTAHDTYMYVHYTVWRGLHMDPTPRVGNIDRLVNPWIPDAIMRQRSRNCRAHWRTSRDTDLRLVTPTYWLSVLIKTPPLV